MHSSASLYTDEQYQLKKLYKLYKYAIWCKQKLNIQIKSVLYTQFGLLHSAVRE